MWNYKFKLITQQCLVIYPIMRDNFPITRPFFCLHWFSYLTKIHSKTIGLSVNYLQDRWWEKSARVYNIKSIQRDADWVKRVAVPTPDDWQCFLCECHCQLPLSSHSLTHVYMSPSLALIADISHSSLVLLTHFFFFFFFCIVNIIIFLL